MPSLSSSTRDYRVKVAIMRVLNWVRRTFERVALFVAHYLPEPKWVRDMIFIPLIVGIAPPLIAQEFNLDFLKKPKVFLSGYSTIFLILAEAYFVMLLLSLVGHRMQSVLNSFRICVRAEDLDYSHLGFRLARPGESHLGQCLSPRPFFRKYFPRKAKQIKNTPPTDEDSVQEYSEQDLEGLLRNGQGFLVVDLPLQGKTMTILQILRRMTGYTVVSPKVGEIPSQQIFNLLSGRQVVVFLDNLGSFPADYDIRYFMQQICRITGNCYGVVGTCRSGADFSALIAGHGELTQFCEGMLLLYLVHMTTDERFELARTTEMTPTLTREEILKHYPLPGNITMRWWTQHMVGVFNSLGIEEKDVLCSIKLLNTGGISVTCSRVLAVMHYVFDHDVDQHTIENTFTHLRDKHFLFPEPSARQQITITIENAVSYKEGSEPTAAHWQKLTHALQETKDVEALLYISINQGRSGDLRRALQTVDACLGIDDKNAQVHFQRGYTLALLGELEKAKEANTRALELQEDFAEAWNNRGFILSRLGELEDAEASIRRALKLNPEFEDAYTNLGIVLARSGRIAKGLQEIRTSLEIRPENYHACLNMAIILSQDGNLAHALAACDEALKIRHGDFPQAHFTRGIILAKLAMLETSTTVKMTRLQEALVAHEKAISQRGNYAEAHMYRGITLFHMERYAEAVSAHTQAIKMRDDYALAFMNRGLTYAHMGNDYLEQARNDGQKALDIGNVPLDSVLAIAKTLGIHGAYDESCHMIECILSNAPEFSNAHLQLAIVLDRMGKPTMAQGEFACAHAFGLDTEELHEKWAFNYIKLGELDKAIDEHTEVLRLNPENGLAYMNRGQTYAKIGDLNRALSDFRRARQLDRKNPKICLNLGITLARLSRHEPDLEKEALATLDEATNLDPQYVEAYFAKAKTKSLFARNSRHHLDSIFDFVTSALSKAITIDNNIIRQINNEMAFNIWRNHPQYADRFRDLVWNEAVDTKSWLESTGSGDKK